MAERAFDLCVGLQSRETLTAAPVARTRRDRLTRLELSIMLSLHLFDYWFSLPFHQLGATCYAAALLQTWFHNTRFRNAVYRLTSPDEAEAIDVRSFCSHAPGFETSSIFATQLTLLVCLGFSSSLPRPRRCNFRPFSLACKNRDCSPMIPRALSRVSSSCKINSRMLRSKSTLSDIGACD